MQNLIVVYTQLL